MTLEKFSNPKEGKIKLTEDEKEIFEDFKDQCREKGVEHRSLIKKIAYMYKLR